VADPRRFLNYGARTPARSAFITVARSSVFRLLGACLVLAGELAPGTRVRGHQGSSAPQISDFPSRLSQAEFGIYSHARTVIEWTPKEIRDCPSLYKLRPATGEDALPLVLKRVGERAAAMIAEFRNVACDERVYSEWNVGSPIATWREMGPNEVAHHFLYVIISRPAGDPRMFTEYRTDPKGNPVDLARLSDLPLMTTNFAASWAYFNSSNQKESRFRYLGEEALRKQTCFVVGFAQKPDVARNFTTFEFGKQSAVILVEGLAWIDKGSFQLVRLETWLLAPRDDIGLKSQETIVGYAAVQPSGLKNKLWLPSEVTVLVHYNNVFVRNTHRYSRFKLFQVHVVTNSSVHKKTQRESSTPATGHGECR
jgi:hypothetical protein